MAYAQVEGVDGRGLTLKGSNVPAERRRRAHQVVVVWVSSSPDSFLRLQLTASAGRAGQAPGCIIKFEIMLTDFCAAVIAAITAGEGALRRS